MSQPVLPGHATDPGGRLRFSPRAKRLSLRCFRALTGGHVTAPRFVSEREAMAFAH